MFEVYRYPALDFKRDENLEDMYGNYTNYSDDEYLEMPTVDTKYPDLSKILDSIIDTENIICALYVCKNMSDLKKAFPKYNNAGGFYEGEFSIEKDGWYFIMPEWGSNIICIPSKFKDKAIQYISNYEENEELEAEEEYDKHARDLETIQKLNEDSTNTLIANFRKVLENSKYEENMDMSENNGSYIDTWFSNWSPEESRFSRIHLISFILLRINFEPNLSFEIHVSFKASKADYKDDFGGYVLPYEGDVKAEYPLDENNITEEFLKKQLDTLREQALKEFQAYYKRKQYNTSQFLEAIQDTNPEEYFMSLMNSSKLKQRKHIRLSSKTSILNKLYDR